MVFAPLRYGRSVSSVMIVRHKEWEYFCGSLWKSRALRKRPTRLRWRPGACGHDTPGLAAVRFITVLIRNLRSEGLRFSKARAHRRPSRGAQEAWARAPSPGFRRTASRPRDREVVA